MCQIHNCIIQLFESFLQHLATGLCFDALLVAATVLLVACSDDS
jgi:hypothetical protein